MLKIDKTVHRNFVSTATVLFWAIASMTHSSDNQSKCFFRIHSGGLDQLERTFETDAFRSLRGKDVPWIDASSILNEPESSFVILIGPRKCMPDTASLPSELWGRIDALLIHSYHEQWLSIIDSCENLSRLSVSGDLFSNTSASFLSNKKELISVKIQSRSVNDEVFYYLNSLPKLKSIVLIDAPVTGSGLRGPQRFPKVTSLSICFSSKFEAHQLSQYERPESIKTLRLIDCHLQNEDLKYLKRFSNLERLSLCVNEITDISDIIAFRELKELDINQTKVNEESRRMITVRCPSLAIEWMAAYSGCFH